MNDEEEEEEGEEVEKNGTDTIALAYREMHTNWSMWLCVSEFIRSPGLHARSHLNNIQ